MLIYLGLGIIYLLISTYINREGTMAVIDSLVVKLGLNVTIIATILAVLLILLAYPVFILAKIVTLLAGMKN